MIKAIFYSKFDTQEGMSNLYHALPATNYLQVPKSSTKSPMGLSFPPPTAPAQSLYLTFSDVSFFVIPRQGLCGNLLQVCTNGYRILGYPICMKSARYDRNEFIFNFCIVLAEEDDFSTYKSVVQKIADLMHGLEEQNGFLSRDFSRSGEGKVHSLCEMLMEDLNNYCECMIPIDELNTLNIKLFPIYPSPPPVKAWHVPLFTLRYQAFMDENWDLTMQRIVPHINGINSVRIISILADTDFSLTCRAIRHLLYYGCLFLLDIFSFAAIYAPTAQISATIGSDEAMQLECARYVNLRFAPHFPIGPSSPLPPSLIPGGSSANGSGTGPLSSSLTDQAPSLSRDDSRFDAEEIWPLLGPPEEADTTTNHTNDSTNPALSSSSDTSTALSNNQTIPLHKPAIVDGVALVELYASLKQGQSVKQWYAQHSRTLTNIDIRRFITFGVIKGFLYRVHKYACATGHAALTPRGPGTAMPTPIPTATPTPVATGPSSRATTGTTTPYTVSSVGDEAPLSGRESSRERAGSILSGGRNGHGIGNGAGFFEEYEVEEVDNRVLERYLDGTHCFDQICTELELSERELTARLKRYPGEVLILHR
ncbi:hypothetical protein N7508_004161 [Penicillium antarcticum]|uniref:uncharacterized protein n=1 Tax=Penicillium antarcticum TaxID=416450 RepID=UPI0023A22587|nr:uncharacterized protein N7508_004161 [Penicillium antarcticum]KAJ5308782.1 hypothetical protein N7508_004161 [Penicillium antarcticum]